MKKVLLVAAVLAAAAGAANADVTLNLGNANLVGGTYVGGAVGLTGTLTGITISFDFQPDAAAQSAGSWAADTILFVQGPDLNTAEWGGYNLSFGGFDEGDWAVIPPTTAPGIYAETDTVSNATPPSGAGSWFVAFANGWGSSPAVQYNNISVTLHGVNVPTPGAMALLGLGGLVATRRRR